MRTQTHPKTIHTHANMHMHTNISETQPGTSYSQTFDYQFVGDSSRLTIDVCTNAKRHYTQATFLGLCAWVDFKWLKKLGQLENARLLIMIQAINIATFLTFTAKKWPHLIPYLPLFSVLLNYVAITHHFMAPHHNLHVQPSNVKLYFQGQTPKIPESIPEFKNYSTSKTTALKNFWFWYNICI